MNLRPLILAMLGLALFAPDALWAQPGYMRTGGFRSRRSDGDDAGREERRRDKDEKKPSKSEKAKEDDTLPMGTSKKDIETYLQRRLAKAKSAHNEQSKFGRGMGAAWAKFWDQMYEDRKDFEVRIARQRLNLFESLDSLQPDYHAQTVSAYEKMQDTMIRSFDKSQKDKAFAYFDRLFKDLKSFQQEQESYRLDMMKAELQAWEAQKRATKEKARKK